ncbi:hypothetical protein AAVH_31453 [Aphelenchoides avenae]|nr:hypothetical protein AAVH_31453 [Aphelenchus avenae]
MRNEDANEAVSDAESAGEDDDAYEEMMHKKRKLEKRLSSQDKTPGHRSGSLTEAKECVSAVLYQAFRATEPLESQAGLAVVGKKNRTQESLLENKLMYHLNENISR